MRSRHAHPAPSQERDLPRKADDATIWETDEAGLRFVLEEGKLAMIVRIAIAHAVWVGKACSGDASVGSLDEDQSDALEAMGRGPLGVIANAWLHEEALQTLEPALVVELITACVVAAREAGVAVDAATAAAAAGADAADAGTGGSSPAAAAPRAAVAPVVLPSGFPTAAAREAARGPGGLGALALRLVSRVGAKLNRLPEGRILAELLRFSTLAALMGHLQANGAGTGAAAAREGLAGLAMLLGGEEIGAARGELLADPDARAALLASTEAGGCLKLACEDAATKRRLRPVLDLVRAARRLGTPA